MTGGHLYQRRMIEAAPAHGFEVLVTALKPAPAPVLVMRTRDALSRAARDGTAGVLLDSIAASWAAPWLRRRTPELPVVGVVHQPPGGLEAGRAVRPLLRRLDLSAYRRADLLIVTGQPVAEQLVASGLPLDRVRVVTPGVERTAKAGPAPDLRRGRCAALICIANWQRRKGIDLLLDALAALPPELATLHLVGDPDADPPYTRRLRRRLEEKELPGRVVAHGILPHDRAIAMLLGADAFVLPSFEEPYGMVYAEALQAGLPVIGWRSGNLPRLVESGVEGLLAEPGDVAGLAACIRRLVEDEALRKAMAAAARRRSLRLPSWEDAAAAFFAAVQEALAQARGAPVTRREALKSSE
jgi:glycosyltransferase involved in cell wall biosynthesis